MPALTRALVERHALGRADAYDAALLDVAQDHLLYLLAEAGCFQGDGLLFKGGTSLRKCRLGNDGRFSTDLDFAAPDEDVVLDTCGLVDGGRVGGFVFKLDTDRGDGRHWRLQVSHEDLGVPNIEASVEFVRRPLVLPAVWLDFVPLPVHKSYGFELPVLPVVAEAEACAEKLARYRRISLGRDLYDLNHFAGRQIDEPLVRRLWVLKVWGDVVDDGRGGRPLDPKTCSVSAGQLISHSIRSACSRAPLRSSNGRSGFGHDFGSSRSWTTTSADGRRATSETRARSPLRSSG